MKTNLIKTVRIALGFATLTALYLVAWRIFHQGPLPAITTFHLFGPISQWWDIIGVTYFGTCGMRVWLQLGYDKERNAQIFFAFVTSATAVLALANGPKDHARICLTVALISGLTVSIGIALAVYICWLIYCYFAWIFTGKWPKLESKKEE